MDRKRFLVILVMSALLFSSTIAGAAGPDPIITSLSPDSGEVGQELEITIFGENFVEGTNVSFGWTGIIVNSVTFVSDTEIRVSVTIAFWDIILGPRDVTVLNPDEQSDTLEGGFTIVDVTPPPPITGLTATDAFDSKIDLIWDRSLIVDFLFYSIYTSDVEFTDVSGMGPLAIVSDITACSYQVTGLEDGTEYYFAVTAIDVSDNEDTAVTCVSATPTTSHIPAAVLEISGVTTTPLEPEAGDSVTITATVGNSGDADATDARFWFVLDGAQIGEEVWTVPAGESVDVSWEWVAEEGSHDVWVWVVGSDDTVLAESPVTTIDVAEAAGFPILPVVLGIIGGLVLLGLIYWLVSWLRGRGVDKEADKKLKDAEKDLTGKAKKLAEINKMLEMGMDPEQFEKWKKRQEKLKQKEREEQKAEAAKKAGKKKKAEAVKKAKGEEFYVQTKRLNVFSEPDEFMGELLETLVYNHVVRVIDFDEDETWQKVITANGTIGWVPTSSIVEHKRPVIQGRVAEGKAKGDEEIGAGIKG